MLGVSERADAIDLAGHQRPGGKRTLEQQPAALSEVWEEEKTREE